MEQRNLFDSIPSGFFNCLSSASPNYKIYADCFEVIAKVYDEEISYRILRDQLKDAVEIYLRENHIELINEDKQKGKDYGELASDIIRKFCSKEVGWLEKDNDGATFKEYISMTEYGSLLITFLRQMKEGRREEYFKYINSIYKTLKDKQSWNKHPYAECIKIVYDDSKSLSNALKRLSISVKKIIEQMMRQTNFNGWVQNMDRYLSGDFIPEFYRLTVEHGNGNLYMDSIQDMIDEIHENQELMDKIINECMKDERLTKEDASYRVDKMIYSISDFVERDYNLIVDDIGRKMNLYIRKARNQLKFIQRENDNSTGKILDYIINDLDEIELNENLPDDVMKLFILHSSSFIEESSIWYPGVSKTVKEGDEIQERTITKEELKELLEEQKRKSYNPYSKEMSKKYIEKYMGDNFELEAKNLPMDTRENMLYLLSAMVYAESNGYIVHKKDSYIESDTMIIHDFTVERKRKNGH